GGGEVGAHTREFRGRAQEVALQARAVRSVVARGALRVGVADGTERARLVDERGRLDRTVLEVGAGAPDLTPGDAEGSPGPHVEREVDVPAEDVRERDRDLFARAGGLDSFEERVIDDSTHGAAARLERVLQ